jgi:hypothetical protein
MAEVLAPARLDIEQEFTGGFEGIMEKLVTLDDLLQAHENLMAEIVGEMPHEHRKFLPSFKEGSTEAATRTKARCAGDFSIRGDHGDVGVSKLIECF